MRLKSIVLEILRSYMPTRGLTEAMQGELKYVVENTLTNHIKDIIPNKKLVVKGRVAQGRRADVPWVGIHDVNINSKAQSGVYAAILFNIDGSGFAISIQHGTDNIKKSEIESKVKSISKSIVAPSSEFITSPLSIRPTNTISTEQPKYDRARNYEMANILGKEYKLDSIPSDIESDLINLVKAYQDWIAINIYNDLEEEYQLPAYDESISDLEVYNIEDLPHKRQETESNISSNIKLPRDKINGMKALLEADYKCEFNPEHTTFIATSGNFYMEKHHLIPMEQYYNFELSIDHYKNIYSLCPNCHRQVHYGDSSNKEIIVSKLYNQRASYYKETYNVDLSDILSYYSEYNKR